MAAVWLRLRAELRTRWRSVLVLTVLVAIATATVLTVAAGARRAATAVDRFLAETRTQEALVQIGTPEQPADPAFFDEVEQLPGVDTLGRIVFYGVFLKGHGFLPLSASVDGTEGTAVNRFPLVAGRRADPDADDEIMLAESVAADMALEPGDRLRIRTFAPDQAAALEQVESANAPFAGPDLTFTVVGIVRTGQDLVRSSRELVPALATPAFYERYGGEILEFARAAGVLLDGDTTTVAAFRERVANVAGPVADLRFESIATYSDSLDEAVEVLAAGLWIFAATTVLAALVALGVVLGRQAFVAARDDEALAALGMSRRHRFAVNFTPFVVAAAVGAGIGVLGAVAASAIMPVGGLARRIEPDLGVDVDLLVLGLGYAAMVVVVATLGALAAWRESGRAIAAARAAGRPGATWHVANRLARAGAGPATVTGVRMALEAGRGRTAVPVRPALVGAIAGVTGVVAALTFGSALDRLNSSPARFGFGWDVGVADADLDALRRDPDVEAIAEGLFQMPLAIDEHPVNATGIRSIEGDVFTTVVEGRRAHAPDEVVLGADTLDRTGRSIGDTIDASGPDGSRRLRIVGRGVFPSVDDSAPFADGAALTGEGADALGLSEFPDVFHQYLVRWQEGTDVKAATARLAGRFEVAQPVQPAEVARFDQIIALPRVLAGFLGLLAVLAVGYALVTAVQRRRRDFAVLETLGFVTRQVSAAVAWQATTLGLIGLALGIPLGLVAGRWTWVFVANSLGVANDLTVPFVALMIAFATALLVVNLVAFVPSRIAARTRPAVVLRAE